MTPTLVCVGAVLGFWLLGGPGGAVSGGFMGYLLAEVVKLRQQVRGKEPARDDFVHGEILKLRRRIRRLEESQAATDPVPDSADAPEPPAVAEDRDPAPAGPVATTDATPDPLESEPDPPAPPRAVEADVPSAAHAAAEVTSARSEPEAPREVESPSVEVPVPSGDEAPSRGAPPAHQGPSFDVLGRLFALIKTWATTGNVPVKVGVLLSLIGLGFLLGVALEQGWITLTIEVRHILVAIFGFLLMGVGWRVRGRNAIYGLSLQGGGIAVLYLTTYFAHAVYDLLPVTAAAAAVVVVTVGAGVLAVLGDARSLAVLGILGGFLAPILAYSDAEDHVLVFGFFAILSTAIVALAWFKIWPELNLLGLGFTLGLTAYWLATRYRHDDWATTQPLIALLIFLYMAIPLLFAVRQAPNILSYMTSPFVFGVPFAGLAVQYYLTQSLEYGPAISSLILGVVHGGFALIARRSGEKWRPLTESYYVLCSTFVAIAVPLGLEAQYTSIVWAIQGTVLLVIGIRHAREVFLIGGPLLHLLGGVSFFVYLEEILPYSDTLIPSSLHGFLLNNLDYRLVVTSLALAVVYGSVAGLVNRLGKELDDARVYRETYMVTGLAFLTLTVLISFDIEFASMLSILMGVTMTWIGLRGHNVSLWCGGILQALGVGLFVGFLVESLPYTDGDLTGPISSFLVDNYEYWPALVALILAAVYTGFSVTVRRSDRLDEFRGIAEEGSLLVGMAFLTVAVVLTFDTAFVSMIVALQGAVVAWWGIRQRRVATSWGGGAFQVLGGVFLVSFLDVSLPYAPGTTLLFNPYFSAASVVALSGLVTGWVLDRERYTSKDPGWTAWLGLVWGVGWWLWGGLGEIVGQVGSDYRLSFSIVFVTISLAGLALAAPALRWPRLATLGVALLPALVLALNGALSSQDHPFEFNGWAAWIVALAIYYVVLYFRANSFPTFAAPMHVAGYWILAILAWTEVHWQVDRVSSGVWATTASLATVLALVAATLLARRAIAWPLATHWRIYLSTAAPVLLVVAVTVFLLMLTSDGASPPLTYLPLLNPLEGLVILTVVVVLAWKRLVREQEDHPLDDLVGSSWTPGLAIIGILFLTMAVARTVHHWLEVPFDFDSMIESTTLHASLSIVWGLTGLSGMVVGMRLVRRAVWVGGASLMGVVVVKLFLFDLSNTGTVARVVSFLGVGLLLLVVGYFAPVPPAASSHTDETDSRGDPEDSDPPDSGS